MIIDDAIIQRIRAVREKLGSECNYDPRKIADFIQKKKNQITKVFSRHL